MDDLKNYLAVKQKLLEFLNQDIKSANSRDQVFIRKQMIELKQEIIMIEGAIDYYVNIN